MTNWDQGYVTDVNYTYGYYAELNPLRVNLAFVNSGLVPPEVATGCELGYGQGISTNFHAAASDIRWYGTDFNPAQAAFARSLAAECGNGAQLFDDSFAEFVGRPDLPDFDYIGLHGIISWVSDENKALIVDFIRRKLKVGGVVYISYNTMPGWSDFAPVRSLMAEHGEVMGAPGDGVLKRVDGALDFVKNLLDLNPKFLRANPQLRARLDKVREQDRHYLAHEYFNDHWHPISFPDMRKFLGTAKLEFGCSAHPLDNVDVLNMTEEQIKFLYGIRDSGFRETVKDYIVNQRFRRDYWVKGARRLKPAEQAERLRRLRVVLVVDGSTFPMKVMGSLGEASLSESVYRPIFEALSDHKPKSIGEIEDTVKSAEIHLPQIAQALMILAGKGAIFAAQDDAVINKSAKVCEKLNSIVMNDAREGNDIKFLVSPVTGGGIPVDRLEQLFLASIRTGRKRSEEWADVAWKILASRGQRFVKDGKPLESADENIKEITALASKFAQQGLARLRALKIA